MAADEKGMEYAAPYQHYDCKPAPLSSPLDPTCRQTAYQGSLDDAEENDDWDNGDNPARTESAPW